MTTRNKTIYPPRGLFVGSSAYPLRTPATPMMSTRQRPMMEPSDFSSPNTQAEFSTIPQPAPSKFKELLDEYQSKYGELNTPMMSTRQRPMMEPGGFSSPNTQADFSSIPQPAPSKFKELLDEYQSKYGTPGSSMMSMKEGYGSYGSNNSYPEYNALQDPMFIEKARQVRQKNTRQDWQATGANKLAKFMYTNPYERARGLMIQGIADAGMNWFGSKAREKGLDTRPLEPRNVYERALETIPRYAYNAAVTKVLTEGVLGGAAFLGGKTKSLISPFFKNVKPQILSKYPALQTIGTRIENFANGKPLKILGKGGKIFKEAMMPSWKDLPLQSLAMGTSQALFNPQSELGKYGADILGLGLLNMGSPMNLMTVPFRAAFKNLPKTLLKTPPKQLAKNLIQNPKVQEFGENVVIGEGAKRIIANILDPRSELNLRRKEEIKDNFNSQFNQNPLLHLSSALFQSPNEFFRQPLSKHLMPFMNESFLNLVLPLNEESLNKQNRGK